MQNAFVHIRKYSSIFYTLLLVFFLEKSSGESSGRLLSEVRQLTFDSIRAGEGYFSSDGNLLVYQCEKVPKNPFYQIFVLNLLTGEDKQISSGIGKTTCAWIHPSGKSVLYSSTHLDPNSLDLQSFEYDQRASGKSRKYSWDYDENYDIFSKSLDTGQLSRLTKHKGYDAEASYSPQGDKILFSSNREAYSKPLSEKHKLILQRDPAFFNDLYIMESNGSNPRRLTSALGYDGGPFFNSKGDMICWRRFSSDGHNAEIYTMDLDSESEQRLTDLKVMSWAPYFHPSNKYIIFATNIHGFNNFELYMVDLKGKRKPVRVTERKGFDGLPSFSPDGLTLSWTSNQTNSGKSQLFLAKWNHNLALQKLGLTTGNDDLLLSNVTQGSWDKTIPDLSIEDSKFHIDFLTDDKLAGRLTGTEGARIAGEFVAKQFQKMGLEPFENDKWHQEFPFTHSAKVDSGSTLIWKKIAQETLVLEQDWNPLSFSESGVLEVDDLIFAGYGLRPKQLVNEDEYDSYTHLEVKDKCVIVLGGLPDSWSEEEKENLRYDGTYQKKARIARDLGAKGIIFINPESDEPVSFSKSFANEMISIKSLSLSKNFVRKVFSSNGRNFASILSKISKGEPYMGFALPKTYLKGKITVIRERGTGINTLGLLKGSGNRNNNKLIVIGAHLDHIGRGRRSSRAKKTDFGKIHPGADDNASGIAALLEIAEYLSDLRQKGLFFTDHDILFVTWSGEEIGLIGSSYFVKNFTLPHGKTINEKVMAYLNMDMIGRFKDKLTLHGVGSSSKWSAFIQKANISTGINLNLQQDSHIPTDTTSFVSKSIPILSAFTGLHDDYHSPTDTADKINHKGIVKCAELFSKLLIILSSEEDLDFIEQTPPKKRMGALRAYLGTIPNYSQTDKQGVLLSGVTKGGPADKAGLMADDLIISLNQVTVENIYDYTDAIGSLKPNVTSSIKIIRADEKLTLEITPLSR